MIRSIRPAFGFALLCCLTLAATAQEKKGKMDDKKAFDDAEFVMKASEGGMYEVALGKVAGKMASSDAVKKFGMQMVKDHTKANDELKKIASAGGMKVADKLSEKDAAKVEKMKGMKGAEFDKAYVKDMVKDHEMDVKEFTMASEKAKAPALKEYATKTLPTLKEHLEMIKKLQGRNGQEVTARRGRGASSAPAFFRFRG